MTSLKEKIEEQFKLAMKNRNEVEISTLRMLRAAIKNKEIELGKEKPIDDAGIIALIQKMVKQHEEAIDQFKKGNRQDLVEKELKEISVLQPLLPAQLGLADVEKAVQTAISKLGATSIKQMGDIMKALGAEFAGRADMKEVSRIVREKLLK